MRDRGLKKEAIEHYQQYLDNNEVSLAARSDISLNIATLYLEMRQCDQAVVWYLHAQTAQPSAAGVQSFDSKIQQCRSLESTSE